MERVPSSFLSMKTKALDQNWRRDLLRCQDRLR